MAFIWEGMFAHQEYEWFILIEGIFCITWGYMIITGRYNDPVIALHIDDRGISQEKALGEVESISWDDIKAVSLGSHDIRVKYKKSEEPNKIKLPACSYKQRQKLKATLSDAATEFDLKYGMV